MPEPVRRGQPSGADPRGHVGERRRDAGRHGPRARELSPASRRPRRGAVSGPERDRGASGVAVAVGDDRDRAAQGQRLDGAARLVAALLPRGAQARDRQPAPQEGVLRRRLPDAQPRTAGSGMAGAGVRAGRPRRRLPRKRRIVPGLDRSRLMDLGLTGKVAIVGGGSDGLGFEIADRLLNEGAFVTIFGRRAEKAAAAAEELSRRHGGDKILGLAADCANADDIDRVTASTVARFGAAVHVLVTNDGGPPVRPISELTDDVWVTAFARHFFYVVRSVRATLPYMTAEGGSILNVVSAVVERPAITMAAPVSVWSAVIGYAKTLALEIGQHDINVNTL